MRPDLKTGLGATDGMPARGSLITSSPGLVGWVEDPHVGSAMGHDKRPIAYERKVPEHLLYTPRC